MARMLYKLWGQGMDCLTSAEEAALARLSAVHQRLIFDNGRVNIKNESGFNACVAFLDVLAATANVLGLEHALRSYRDSFTVNYRALFPDGAQHYRVDILEASIEQYAAIWVNGDKYEFSARAIHLAGLLQESWLDLNRLLDDSLDRQQRAPARPGKLELRRALESLDTAWADFEHVYISDLIGIEEKARMFVVESVTREQQLCHIEARSHKSSSLSTRSEYKETQRQLVACIARLNAVANYKRKGRDDLGAEVLFAACATLQRCDHERQDTHDDGKARHAARMLATDVVESFDALRAYLREVANCLERVDPHLCNNPGLVQRLVDWEESWEVGARYVQHDGLLDSISDLVFQIQTAQKYVPALTTMCEECDVELFLALPRILWLCFLLEPWKHVDLMRSLVPDRFSGADTEDWHPELQALSADFQRTLLRLVKSTESDNVAWQILVKRAIVGSWSQDCTAPLAKLDHCIQHAVDDLLHELEKWSMEVQRHCPEDWNQCSAILVQCLLTDSKPRETPEFCV